MGKRCLTKELLLEGYVRVRPEQILKEYNLVPSNRLRLIPIPELVAGSLESLPKLICQVRLLNEVED